MKEVDLPLMQISAELSAAINILRTGQRAALVVEQQNKYFVFSAGNIVVGRSEGAKTLRDLKPTVVVSNPAPEKKREGFSVVTALPDFGSTGGKLVGEYLISKLSQTLVHVLIKDDSVAMNYVSGMRDYYCNGPRHHDDFPPPDVVEGDPCPHGDGYTVVSAK